MELKGSKTEGNLKAAFAGESQANRRYLYFAAKADVEGQKDVAAVFRSTAEGEPAMPTVIWSIWKAAETRPLACLSVRLVRICRQPSPGRRTNIAICTPGMAKSARDEGFDEIADWFETLAKAERSHANRFQKALDSLAD